MAEKTPAQVIINTDADSSLQRVYPGTFQNVPPVVGNTSIYISATTENIYNNYVVNNNDPVGNTTEVQFNLNNHMAADSGLTYNYVTDSLTVAGNLTAGNVKTDNLLYANGVAWNLSGGYGNTNVGAYLTTYTGNIAGNRITGTLFTGSGAGLTSVPAGSLVGAIANANYANFAGTLLTNAQPNITSVGTLTSLTITGNLTSGNANLGNLVTANYFTGNGSLLTSLTGSNVSGNVTSAVQSHYANIANSVAGGNVSGQVGNALIAGTVYTNAQPNITSTGSLTGLTVSNTTGVVDFTTTANVTLGAVGNLHITGGSASQFLQTNGSGTLSWATPATSNLQQVTNAGGTTDVAVSITNTTESINYSTGALKVSGGIGVANTIHAQGHISSVTTVYAGLYADFSSYTYPKFVGRDAGSEYIQAAMVNTHEHGSADWVAYGDNSNETQGWSDFGYCGSAFNDANYTITKPNDGYFFVQGMDSITGGNMVLATGGYGLNHDIVFATGGFLSTNEKFRFSHTNNELIPNSNNTMKLGNSSLYYSNAYVANVVSSQLYGNINFPDTTTLTTAPRDEPKFSLKYATFSVEVGKRYMVDSVTQPAITTLPASPSTGDAIFFVDAYGTFNTNNFIIHPNGKTIMGASGDYTVSTNNLAFGLVYNGSGDWRTY